MYIYGSGCSALWNTITYLFFSSLILDLQKIFVVLFFTLNWYFVMRFSRQQILGTQPKSDGFYRLHYFWYSGDDAWMGPLNEWKRLIGDLTMTMSWELGHTPRWNCVPIQIVDYGVVGSITVRVQFRLMISWQKI